ncbi:hypothetical protein N9Y37_01910 [Luminiphilus sp.]|nr:hypothetical protein [Luminiphilus sp.]
MPAKYAVTNTGSRIISEKLPGFKNMKASYRWLGLALFGFWSVLVVIASRDNKRKVVALSCACLFAVSVLNLPHLNRKLHKDQGNRESFLHLASELVGELIGLVTVGEQVVFLPYGNDFVANFLFPRFGLKSCNVGDDKNLQLAQESWPSILRWFK